MATTQVWVISYTPIPNSRFYALWRQHYVWAGGHFILLISAMRYILAWATFKTPSTWWYIGSTLNFLNIERCLIVTCAQQVTSGHSLAIVSCVSK